MTLSTIKKCMKYHDYKTACYLALSLAEADPEYFLLSGILLYYSGEYSRAIPYLSRNATTTSVFYRALSYRGQKSYSMAISCIETILDGCTTTDSSDDRWYCSFFVDPADKEFYLTLLGELYIQSGRSQPGIKCMASAMSISPLLPAAEALYSEGILIRDLPACPVSLFYTNLFEFVSEKWNSSTGCRAIPSIALAIKNLPGTGSYLVAKAAAASARFGNSKEAGRLFKLLRRKDPSWISGLDAYSTMLWREHDENSLGLLAKELISSHPDHYITWIVIGNFYSLRKKNGEAIQAFLRSISIRENSHAYALLGFEFNHKSCFVDAQGCFRSSLCMLENNDRALFGLGISYAETFKKELATVYFTKAMLVNPHSLHMKAYLVRFYVRVKEYAKALERIGEYFCLDMANPCDIVRLIEAKAGNYSELEELMLCELAEVLFREGSKDLAIKVLDSVACRTTTYFSKRALIETEE